MKVYELKALLEKCEEDWDICYLANDGTDTIVDIEELSQDPDYPRTYILF